MWVALRDGDRVFKIVRLGAGAGVERRVYDLEEDPTEARNLYDPKDADQARDFEPLERRRGDLVRAFAASGSSEPESDAHGLLRRLGYVE
jgi:hypothetical protein